MASISRPVVERVVVVRSEVAAKSISNSPSAQLMASKNSSDRLRHRRGARPCTAPRRKIARSFWPLWLSASRQDFCPISERLHQLGHAHLFEASLNHARRAERAAAVFPGATRSTNFFATRTRSAAKNGLGRKSSAATSGRSFSSMSPRLATKINGVLPRGFAPAQFLVKLAPVESGHFEIGDDQIRRGVDGLEQRVRAVGGEDHVAERLECLRHEFAHQRIIVHHQHVHRLGGWQFIRGFGRVLRR